MNLRDLKPTTIRRIAVECDSEFDQWLKTTNGEVSQITNGKTEKVPASPQDIWRTAFSKGSSAILRRVDALKDI